MLLVTLFSDIILLCLFYPTSDKFPSYAPFGIGNLKIKFFHLKVLIKYFLIVQNTPQSDKSLKILNANNQYKNQINIFIQIEISLMTILKLLTLYYNFSAMYIINILIKPFSLIYSFQSYRDRGGEYESRFGEYFSVADKYYQIVLLSMRFSQTYHT